MSDAALAPESPKRMTKLFWGAVLASLVGLVAALLCLRQWGQPDPWARLDLYSGGFLVLSMVALVAQFTTFLRSALRSKGVAREALGLSYDPTMLRLAALLDVAGLTVLLDYAHWHLTPALERPELQGLGLALVLIAVAWFIWTDWWLARHFSSEPATGELMTDGPYLIVRHPRYGAFLLMRLAMPLIFASVLGWLLWPLWVLLITRRIRREEPHLRELFGAAYDAYASRTARLLPGEPLKKRYWGALLTSIVGLAAALLCLRQWGQPDPWARLDVYSGSFLLLSSLVIVAQFATFMRSAFQSKEVMREALGLSYDDAALLRWAALLDVTGLAVLLDYAHWHLTPALEQPALQDLGLALALLGAALFVWADRWLARHFSDQAAKGKLMTDGPYRLVRHPRYAAFLLVKLAAPLIFASIFGWLLWPLWVVALARRIRREEPHLRELFGAAYDAYASRTARLLPGIY